MFSSCSLCSRKVRIVAWVSSFRMMGSIRCCFGMTSSTILLIASSSTSLLVVPCSPRLSSCISIAAYLPFPLGAYPKRCRFFSSSSGVTRPLNRLRISWVSSCGISASIRLSSDSFSERIVSIECIMYSISFLVESACGTMDRLRLICWMGFVKYSAIK
ncbi:hypothetical protein D3C80_1389850 [compost metagenome]